MARPQPKNDAPPTPSRPPRRGLLTPLVLVVATVALVLVAQQALHGLPGWLNPFGTETKDRSGPVLLKSIRDLHRYEAASGSFQVIVDLEKDAKFLPGSLRGKRTLFVGNGTVDAYVDFSKLGSGAVKVNEDRTAATITLPRAQLENTNLDPKTSYVYATERGLIDRFGDFFSSNPNNQQQLYVLASQKIQSAAQQSNLARQADANTKLMLENMLKALGFTKVTVQQANAQ
ncbi:DUF4230 domain-containing protein [Actinomadura bangladeshensis]|uniref:DUF4230 domain-containing protein n=1 Tax=Actinomadura bangladeshensis TaxID=453573 RepID=A0A6L9QKV2_9ACTN|nr:DUF4230 domain-containing protein [Actinomadura bangladeshensis]NEA25736.1 DUF4230 domain-containing protein [Actinomadura bangladeshensis]